MPTEATERKGLEHQKKPNDIDYHSAIKSILRCQQALDSLHHDLAAFDIDR